VRIRAPDRHEALLHGILRERRVAHDAQREPVGDAAEAVVELRECLLVGARDEGDERLVGQVGKSPRHESTPLARRAQR
jgi:hypothetical protein